MYFHCLIDSKLKYCTNRYCFRFHFQGDRLFNLNILKISKKLCVIFVFFHILKDQIILLNIQLV